MYIALGWVDGWVGGRVGESLGEWVDRWVLGRLWVGRCRWPGVLLPLAILICLLKLQRTTHCIVLPLRQIAHLCPEKKQNKKVGAVLTLEIFVFLSLPSWIFF